MIYCGHEHILHDEESSTGYACSQCNAEVTKG